MWSLWVQDKLTTWHLIELALNDYINHDHIKRILVYKNRIINYSRMNFVRQKLNLSQNFRNLNNQMFVKTCLKLEIRILNKWTQVFQKLNFKTKFFQLSFEGNTYSFIEFKISLKKLMTFFCFNRKMFFGFVEILKVMYLS
jgi:hypothetical protein